jgi:hypothetical protein
MTCCECCGEDWPAALHTKSGLCRDCAVQRGLSREPYRAIISHCPICGRADVPAQWHHVAGKRQGTTRQLKELGLLLCLNCHGIITERQRDGWDPSWKDEDHPVRCTVQGVYDLFWLWWQRSGRRVWDEQLAELAHMVRVGVLALLQLWGLRGWDVVL